MKTKLNKDQRNLLIVKGFSIASVAVQVLILFLHTFGTAILYGKKITLFSSVPVVLDVLNIGTAIYKSIASGAIGVIYIYVLILLIKNLYKSAMALKGILCTKSFEISGVNNSFFIMGSHAIASIKISIFFIIAVRAIKSYTLPFGAKLIICLGILFFLAFHAILWFINEEKPIEILLHLAHAFLLSLSFLFVLIQLKGGAIENAIFAIKGITQITSNAGFVLYNITFSTTIVIALFFALKLLETMTSYRKMTSYAKATSKKLLVSSCIITGCPLFLFIINNFSIDISSIFSAIKPNLSLLFSAITLYIASSMPEKDIVLKIEKMKTIDVENESIVLVIDSSITTISDGQYRDRRDFNEVIIHAGVISIGSRAFDGCGALTAIHCAAPGKPAGWTDDWNDGCYATVHWNSEKAKASNQTPTESENSTEER